MSGSGKREVLNKGAPPITPEQFTALLDAMVECMIADGRMIGRKKVYFLDTDDIWEARDILAGRCGNVHPE